MHLWNQSIYLIKLQIKYITFFNLWKIWRMTLKSTRAPFLCYFKLCASFRSHRWIETGVMVRKPLSWVLASVTLTFDLWHWHFAWKSRLSLVITPQNFIMIRRWKHSEKGVTDKRTDGRTDRRQDGLNHSWGTCSIPRWAVTRLPRWRRRKTRFQGRSLLTML